MDTINPQCIAARGAASVCTACETVRRQETKCANASECCSVGVAVRLTRPKATATIAAPLRTMTVRAASDTLER
jgi:hypothetical protein